MAKKNTDFKLEYELDYNRIRNKINKLFKELFYDIKLNENEKHTYVWLKIPETGEKIKISAMPELDIIEIIPDNPKMMWGDKE